jgi:hypothetical protein
MAEALERICRPPHQKVFSRVGIYCYWDFDTAEILYFGLTGSLPKRFRQHNDLEDCEPHCCKREQIREYFRSHDRLGLSVFVQSKMHDDGVLEAFKDWTLQETMGFSDSYKNVAFAEGQLIDAHEKRFGKLPSWNGNKASREGHGAPSTARGSHFEREILKRITGSEQDGAPGYDLLDNFVGRSLSPLVARCTIRELPGNFRNEVSEDTLHGVRMLMVSRRWSYEQAVAIHRPHDMDGILERLEEDHYFAREPSILRKH